MIHSSQLSITYSHLGLPIMGPNINRPSHFYMVTALLAENLLLPWGVLFLISLPPKFHRTTAFLSKAWLLLKCTFNNTFSQSLWPVFLTVSAEKNQGTTIYTTTIHYLPPPPPPPLHRWGDTRFHLIAPVTFIQMKAWWQHDLDFIILIFFVQ